MRIVDDAQIANYLQISPVSFVGSENTILGLLSRMELLVDDIHVPACKPSFPLSILVYLPFSIFFPENRLPNC